MTKAAKLQQRADALEARRVELANTLVSGVMKFGQMTKVNDEELAFWALIQNPVDGINPSFRELEILTRSHVLSWGGLSW